MKASENNNSYAIERRGKEDRRSFGPPTQFHLFVSTNKLVKKDRRYLPDRRIANIEVKGHFLYIKNDLLKKFIEI